MNGRFVYAFGYVIGALATAGDDDALATAGVDDDVATSTALAASSSAYVALADTQAAATYTAASLPAGDAARNGTLTGIAIVFDAYGAGGEATAVALVTAREWVVDDLEVRSECKDLAHRDR